MPQERRVGELVERCGYPEAVGRHLEEFLSRISPAEHLAVIATGSLARGELSWSRVAGELELLSDYEFVIVTRGRSAGRLRQLVRRAARGLEEELSSRSPLFHVDVTCLSPARLRKLPPTLWTHELSRCGFLLEGEDLRTEIPMVSVSELDFRELNEILLWRLWVMLLYLPARWVRGQELLPQAVVRASYVLCRNVLDLVTWALPWEGELRAGYRERQAYLEENYGRLRCRDAFGPDFPRFTRGCLEGKLSLYFERPLGELHHSAVDYFRRGVVLLTEQMRERPPEEGGGELIRLGPRLFRERSFKRSLYGLRYLFRVPCLSPWASLRWLYRAKHALLVRLLLDLHLALDHLHRGESDECRRRLQGVESDLPLVSLKRAAPPGAGAPPADRWLALREETARFMMENFAWVGHQGDHVRSVLGI